MSPDTPPLPEPSGNRTEVMAPRSPSPRRRAPVVLAAAAGVVALALGVLACGDDEDSNLAEPPPSLSDVPELPDAGDAGEPGEPADDAPGGQPDPDVAVPADQVSEPTPPPTGVPELDEYAQGCFQGDMGDCDLLYLTAIDIQFENEAALDYTIYSQSCGGRLPGTAYLDACTALIPDP